MIWVDADACPVKEQVLRCAQRFHQPVTMVCDVSHDLSRLNCIVLTVDRHSDSADLVIVNRASKGDLLITQDYGLAALALSKGLRVLHQSGMEFTAENIDELLFTRALSGKQRRASRHLKGPKKRTKADDLRFETAFNALLSSLDT